MKTKRFLSLLLSLVLAVSLAAPASAAGDDAATAGPVLLSWYDFQEQYLADHPEIRENFDADAWFAQEYSWWTKEEYMEAYNCDEAGFEEAMWKERVDNCSYYFYDPLNIEISTAYDKYLLELYESRHPGELAALSTEDLLAWRGYTKTLTPIEQYMEDWELSTKEEARTSLLAEYASDRLTVETAHEEFLAYQASYPDKWTEFDADAYFAENKYGSKEDYVNLYSFFTEEEFAETMFVEYARYNHYTWDWENMGDDWYWDGQDYDRIITLYANGVEVDTTVTAGEGVTYADPAVLNEIMGTQLSGSDPVSIRTAAQEAGWDVTWNEYRREVALWDREKLLKGIILPPDAEEDLKEDSPEAQLVREMFGLGTSAGDGLYIQDFSALDQMNQWLQKADQSLAGKTVRTTETFDFTLTAFNSLDGDETYTVTVKADLLMDDNVANLTLTADLAQLWKALPQAVKDKLAAQLPKVTFQNMAALLSGCKAQFILNMEDKTLYWNFPLLSILDDSLDGDAWYRVELSDYLGTVVTVAAEPAAGSTAQKLYDDLLDSTANNWLGTEDAYGTFIMTRLLLNRLAGPDSITRQGDTITWKMDAAALTNYMNMDSPYGYMGSLGTANLFKELNVSISVKSDGSSTFSAALRPDMDVIAAQFVTGSWYDASEAALMNWVMNLFDFRMSADASRTGSRSSGSFLFHWKNQFKLDVKTSGRRQSAADAPLSVPPAGAEVVDLY